MRGDNGGLARMKGGGVLAAPMAVWAIAFAASTLSSAPAWSSVQQEPQVPWGYASIDQNGTITLRIANVGPGGPAPDIVEVYAASSSQYRDTLELVGPITVGENKPLGRPPETVGSALMSADGTITLQLRLVSPSGAVGHTHRTVGPADTDYDVVRRRIGDIRPGEVRRVLADRWRD